MHRFYADPVLSDDHRLILDSEDSRHAVRVLRFSEGDQAEIIFQEKRFLSVLETADETHACFRAVQVLPSTEPALSVILFQGIPKSDKMDWIVQKAVELGVSGIVPVVFSRCVVRLNEKDAERKRERWQKIAREAGKQSGRCRVPEVGLPVSLSALPQLFARCDRIAVPWEECSAGGPLAFFRRHPSLSSLGIVIGPEGGISPDEVDQLVHAGCEPVTLGKRILRTETAGIAAISVFSGLYGEME